jgi:aspartyl-tRNA synthetase
VQLILSDSSLWDRLNEVSLESVIEVSGVVAERPEGQINPKMATGQIEVLCFIILLLRHLYAWA